MKKHIKGRGTIDNPANRFERIYIDNSAFEDSGFSNTESYTQDTCGSEIDATGTGKGNGAETVNREGTLTLSGSRDVRHPASRPKTCFYRDHSQSVMSHNQSPDIPFDYSINPYRGCEHGCIYCYARPTHEYLGFSAGLDFETKIMVKPDAPQILAKELTRPGWLPQAVCLSGNTDCYQPAERRLRITRQCLEVLRDFRNPVTIITKNHLVTRDIDILSEMAALNLVRVSISITSLDPDLTAILEPRTSRPQRRLDAIRQLTNAGITTAVMTAPVIPALNDHEIPALLGAARDAGASRAGYTLLRLPLAVRPLFTEWLDLHYPDRKEKILNRIRNMRGGKLNRSEFISRMKGEGNYAEQISSLFRIHTARLGLNTGRVPVETGQFRIPAVYRKDRQTNLFDAE